MLVHRPIIMTDAGVVVSGHHKASEAGASVLREGGNAIDAAVAASAALSVAIPHMNGIGGDCIALYYDASRRQTIAINGSGRAPQKCSAQTIRAAGFREMPQRGPLAISACGLVDAWESVLERFGTRKLGALLTPAVRLAREGVPIDLVFQSFLAGPVYADLASRFPALIDIYGPAGQRRLGERLHNEALANSLEQIAGDGARVLYEGELGRRLAADLEAAGALLGLEDLKAHKTLLSPPLSVTYGGRRVHVAPPNSQGIALAILAGLADVAAGRTGVLEPFDPGPFLVNKAKAFDVRSTYAGDPERVSRPDRLLEPALLQSLHARDASEPPGLAPGGGDTSTLVVIDRHGNAVSWVQSLFEEFGSGVVSKSTGVVMHNRLALQSLDEGHPFALRPGERPFHTLCPALVEAEGFCEMAIATPGDHGQPQIIFQVLTRHYAESFNLQAAVEAPRIRHDSGSTVMVEDRVPAAWIDTIRRAGLQVTKVGEWSRLAGGVNAIRRFPDGLLMAAADPRRASYAVTAD